MYPDLKETQSFWFTDDIIRIVNSKLKEKEVGGLTLLIFKTYYEATGTNKVRYWQKNRQTSQLDKIAQKYVCLI